MTPEIIAHRGASYLAPENTLSAFRKAIEIGADGVEMDVQQTKDAGLVIHHDYIIDLHTEISGKIYDMTEGELKLLDFGSWKDAIYADEKIATLKEALELCKSMNGITVQLEMKATVDNDPEFVPRVLEEIRAADIADQIVLISFNHDLLRQAKQLMPELRVGALLYGAFESMVLPPPVIWKDLGLTNDLDDGTGAEADTAEENSADAPDSGDIEEENGWLSRWVGDKISMLKASFPGEDLNAVVRHLAEQHDPVKYIKGLDFQVDYVSCEYHTAYSNPKMVEKLHDAGVRVAFWTVDTEDAVRSLLALQPDAIVTNRPDRVREWIEKEQAASAAE